MRMKTEHFNRLVTLSAREGLSLRTYLIMARRALRHIIVADAEERAEMRRDIRAYKRGLPFTQKAMDSLLDAHQRMQKHNRGVLIAYGQFLRDHHRAIEDELGWDGLCDVLCVNPVHRAEACEHDKGLFGLTWIGGHFEDSATVYENVLAGSGPITKAVSSALLDWMMNNSDKLPDPMAPGGPLYGLPTYYQQPNGSMARKSAALTVHGPDGSRRVVERKIEI